MKSTYYVRIKKDFAAALIEDLEKMDAIELLDNGVDTQVVSQKEEEEVKRRIAYYTTNPEQLTAWEDVRKMLNL